VLLVGIAGAYPERHRGTPPPVRPGEPQAGALFALLEKLEMKSSLAEAKQRYSGQAELF